jgi:hypothetical protein
MPDRPSKLPPVNSIPSHSSARPERAAGVALQIRKPIQKGNASSLDALMANNTRLVVRQYWDEVTNEAMSRILAWIDQKHFRGFGCSECGWRFQSSIRPSGNSFDEMMRNFELQRDKEFRLHVCADHLTAKKK